MHFMSLSTHSRYTGFASIPWRWLRDCQRCTVTRELVEAGGLMSYGPNFPDLFRRAADFVDKILRGAKPADIPVEQPTKFDLVINLTTAKALGLAFPDAARPRRRGDRMKRREFITLLGGAAAAWPLAARAQQPGQVQRIGILMPYPKSDAESQSYVRAFRQELARLGWSEGGNFQFDERWSTGNMDLVRADAANLVVLNPDVIVIVGDRVIPILTKLTRSIPIVVA